MLSGVNPLLTAQPIRTFCLLAASLLALAPQAAHADAEAGSLLDRADAALNSARTLSADFTISTIHPTRYSDSQERGTVVLSKPGLARIEITRYRKPVDADRWIASGNGSTVVADGRSVWTLIQHPGSAQYRETEAAPHAVSRALESLEPLSGFFDNAGAHPEARVIGTRKWEAGSYTVIAENSARKGSASVREVFIGDDGLIHRIVTHLQSDGKPVTREVALHHIQLNSAVNSPDPFVFHPPTDAVLIEAGRPAAPLAIGAEAPDFSVESVDGKTVRLSDFRGKVVVLKFFATWCWTCKQSLPETERLAQKYANNDVVVLAVDLWNGRQAFHAWTAKTEFRTIHFAHDDRPQGKDAGSSLYHIASIPAEFIIGRDGKIVGQHSGYEGPDGQLEQSILAATTKQVTDARP